MSLPKDTTNYIISIYSKKVTWILPGYYLDITWILRFYLDITIAQLAHLAFVIYTLHRPWTAYDTDSMDTRSLIT